MWSVSFHTFKVSRETLKGETLQLFTYILAVTYAARGKQAHNNVTSNQQVRRMKNNMA